MEYTSKCQAVIIQKMKSIKEVWVQLQANIAALQNSQQFFLNLVKRL